MEGVDDAELLHYHARGPRLDLQLGRIREGSCASVTGQLVSLDREPAEGIVVQLLDQLGVTATTETDAGGDFDFPGLTRGVYNLRINGSDWEIGVFGLMV